MDQPELTSATSAPCVSRDGGVATCRSLAPTSACPDVGRLAIISGSLLTQEAAWRWRQAPVAVGPSEQLFAGVSSGMAQTNRALSGATGSSIRAKAVF